MSAFDAGRLVMVDIPGKSLDADTAALREQKIRAVCLFRKNLGSEDEVRALMADLARCWAPRR
jgi:beta-N-acetylhexosaminidase